MFALRHKKTKKLMGLTTAANESDFCNDVRFELDDWPDNVWVTTSLAKANYVAATSTPWFNAGHGSHVNPYVGELEVVELEVKNAEA